MGKFSEIREVLIFGSRAMGNYKKESDIDIALKGDTTFSLAAKVKYELEEETYLPFFFDVLPYEKSTHVKLKAHIDQYGISFYRAGWKECTLPSMNTTTDSAVPGLNRNMALATDALIPPQTKITQFNSSVDPLFHKITANKKKIRTLEIGPICLY